MIAISAFLLAISVFFGVKYFLLKNGLKKYENFGTGRKGFYKFRDIFVYVYEIYRYTNGYSKIKIDRIDSSSSYYIGTIKNRFQSMVKTVEIEWLESEDNIKRSRKEKLDKLKKI